MKVISTPPSSGQMPYSPPLSECLDIHTESSVLTTSLEGFKTNNPRYKGDFLDE